MPFGPFASFDDCMSRLAERYPEPETRQRVCCALQSRLGEKSEHGHAVLELPDDARSEWMDAYLESLEKNDGSGAAKVAWATVYRRWERGANGAWNPIKKLDDIQFKSLTKQDRIIYGAASVAIVDSENELITESALKSAFNSYVTRGHVLFYHRNIPIGEVLPSYTAADGKIYKSGVSNGKLDIVVRLYKDTQIANDVWDAIEKGELRAFSIGGQVIGDTVKVCKDDSCSMSYERVDHIDLHEISIVPSPANDASYFTIVKGKSHRMTEKQVTEKEAYPWEECVAEQQAAGADDPEAVCAAIKNRTVAHAKAFGLAKSDDDAKAQVREWLKHPFSKYHISKLMALEAHIRDEKTMAVNCPHSTQKMLKIISGEEDTMPTTDTKYQALEKKLDATRERLESLIDTVSLLVVKTVPIQVTK